MLKEFKGLLEILLCTIHILPKNLYLKDKNYFLRKNCKAL
ncbi:hypothetical protein EMIT0210MI2_80017 [Priestia megaterium]